MPFDTNNLFLLHHDSRLSLTPWTRASEKNFNLSFCCGIHKLRFSNKKQRSLFAAIFIQHQTSHRSSIMAYASHRFPFVFVWLLYCFSSCLLLFNNKEIRTTVNHPSRKIVGVENEAKINLRLSIYLCIYLFIKYCWMKVLVILNLLNLWIHP